MWSYIDTTPIKHYAMVLQLRLCYNDQKGAYILMKRQGDKHWHASPQHKYPAAIGDNLPLLVKIFKKSARLMDQRVRFKTGKVREVYAQLAQSESVPDITT